MADLDNSRSPTPPPRAGRMAPMGLTRAALLAPDNSARKSGKDTIPKLISAHKQPSDATHLSLEESDYLAAGDVCVQEDVAQQEPTPTSPQRFPRVHRTTHLLNASRRLQEVLGDMHDEHEERWQTTGTAAQLDESTRFVEDEVYTLREAMSIKYLKDHQVPLLYSFFNLRKVQHKPERYEGMLRPFYQHPPMDFDAPMHCFFERQTLRWQEFIRFQAHNRCIETMDEPLLEAAYAAALLREASCGPEWRNIHQNWRLAHTQERYMEYVSRRADEMVFLRDKECSNFPEYQAAVLARLDRNGVQRLDQNNAELPGFTLDSEFWKQDPMTTWTEYLAYEYWQMEQYDSDVDDHGTAHDGAYQHLKAAVALSAHETADYLPTEAARLQRRVELDEAYGRYDEAALNLARLEQRRGMWWDLAHVYATHHRRTRFLAAAQADLEAAEAAKSAAVQRDEHIRAFLHETATYREARSIRARHDHLLSWAKQEYDGRLAATLAASAQEAGPSSARPTVSFQLPVDTSAEDVAQERETSGTSQGSRGILPNSSELQPALEIVPRSDFEDGHAGGGLSRDVSLSSAAAESPLVESCAEEPATVKQASAKQTGVLPPAAALSADARELSVTPAGGAADAAAAPTNSSLGPRRSSRIAAMREKAAEEAAIIRTGRRSESLSGRAGSSRSSRKREHGMGNKVVADEEAQDAEPPAKRTRRRTARK